ncbi:MAG: endonuclease/exonuclease/phosphatase family protein [Deltaproteobacteria bacterium]|nr:endonuclease/exonuclease/phosphatase family protein [Deltaproteobacteria bacterium]
MPEARSGPAGAWRLPVATWNIHGWAGWDGLPRPERTLAHLRGLGAEVVALQEVTLAEAGDEGAGAAAELGRATGLLPLWGPTFTKPGGRFGNVLLTAHPVRQVALLDLSLPGREPRGAILAELEVAGRAVRVAATHLGLNRGERRQQVARLWGHLQPDVPYPTIVLGDFNQWPGVGPLAAFRRSGYGLGPRLCTFPARRPVLALDRVLVRAPGCRVQWKVDNRGAVGQISDHLAVQAVLESPGG